MSLTREPYRLLRRNPRSPPDGTPRSCGHDWKPRRNRPGRHTRPTRARRAVSSCPRKAPAAARRRSTTPRPRERRTAAHDGGHSYPRSRRSTPSRPDDRSRVDDRAQLRALVVAAQGVTDDGRGEATLRGERQPVERDDLRSLPNSGDEFVDGLAPRRLRRHESEHDDLVVGNRAKRSERAGPRVVVLEQQSLCANAGEQPLREPVVPPFHEPAACLIAAAEVEAEGDARVISDDVVVELDTELEPALGRPAATFVEPAVCRIDEQRVVRCVQLDVHRAEPHELVDLLTEEFGDVGEELLQVPVRGLRAFRVPEVRKQTGARQRHLDDPVGAAAGVHELFGRERAFAPKRLLDRELRPFDAKLTELVALPLAPEERVEVPLGEALDGRGELALKRESAHLAVGDDRKACLRLELEGVVDRLVLDPLERGGCQLPVGELPLRCEQVGRAKKTADDVRSRVEHALTLWTAGRPAYRRRAGAHAARPHARDAA